MRTLLQGLSGWARFQQTDNRAVKETDTAITVVGTLLVALTWIIIHR